MPRFRLSAASRASRSTARSMPKLRFAASVPAIDWNTRSTGAPCSIAWIWLVTWVSTHDWVGISKRWITSSTSRTMSVSGPSPSPAGLMPITASPAP